MSSTTTPTPIDDSADLVRETVEIADLGAGLTRVVTTWKARPHAGADFAPVGTCDGFELTLGDEGPIELELDRQLEIPARRIHLIWPSGVVDVCNSPQQLLDLARLLARPEVQASLAEWAAQDAAAEAQRKATREGGQ